MSILIRVFLVVVIIGLSIQSAPTAQAQTFPPSCQPVGSMSCAAYRPTEFRHESKSCAFTPYLPTEYEAAQHAQADHIGSDAGCPVETWEFSRWADNEFSNCSGSACTPPNATFSICFPGTGPGPYPRFEAGYDILNYSIYELTRYNGAACEESKSDWGLVRRDRGVVCPEGFFTGVTGSHCEQSSARPQVGKNLGCPDKDDGQCSAGNPINIQMGNKYQSETDYIGTGPNPLRFTRFYNSLAGRISRANNLYRFTGTGGATATRAAVDPSQESGVRAMATDSIGASWRHTYHRALVAYATPNLRTVSMYRQDGKVLMFNEYSGSWHADGDVNFTLTEQTNAGETTGWTVVSPGDEIETYDADGKLTAIADRNGNTVTLAYDSVGRLETVTDHFGRTLTFGYATVLPPGTEWFEDPTVVNQITSMTDPLGNVYQYNYATDGTLTRVTYPDLTFRQYGYNDASGFWDLALTSITDENGDQYATFGYSAGGLANMSYRGQGADIVGRIDVDYSFPGSAPYYYVTGISVTEAQGSAEERSYTINPSYVRGVSKMSGLTRTAANESRTYDANGNVATHNDRNGVQLYREYNGRNLETVRREANGTALQRETTTTWHPTYRLRDVVTEPMRTVDYDYFPNGDLERMTITSRNISGTEDPSADGNRTRIWNYTYNAHGQVTSIDGPRVDVVDVITMGYYHDPSCPVGEGRCGQLEYIINEVGHRTEFNEYYADGRLKTMTDPNGLVTEYEYDTRRRLTKITETGGATARVTDYVYDAAGQIDTVTFPDGLILEYDWTTAHLLRSVTDNLGNRIEYQYNAHGERISEYYVDDSSVIRRAVETTYDNLGFVDAMTVGLLSSGDSITTDYDYDSEGNLLRVTDAELNVTDYLVDELDRVYKITDALTNDIDYVFDELDQVTSVAAPNGATTAMLYDGLGNLDSETSPDRGQIDYDYDDAGNVKIRTDARGVVANYTYDAMNRLTSISYPDSSLDVSLAYDQGTNGLGRLTSMTDSAGTATYSYDIYGNVSSETLVRDGITQVHSYTYDGADRVTSITYPSSKRVDYFYDSTGRADEVRLTDNGTVTVLASSITYRPFGPISGLDFGNGLSLSRTHDLDYRMTAQTTTNVQSLTFDIDSVGNVSSKTDLLDGVQSQIYTYDDLYRLDSAQGGYGSLSYSYDANGNRLTATDDSDSTAYSYTANSNRLSGMTGSDARTISHDASGNITVVNDRELDYADHGRLVEVRDNSVVVANYTYNGRGERARKVTAVGTIYFIYGQGGELLAEFDDSGAVTREYVYLNGEPLALLTNSGGASAEIVLDNGDPGVAVTGNWTGSTAIAGYQGANYLYHAANGAPSGGLVADNTTATYTGTWPNSTSVSGYLGSNYQFHAANGAPPGGQIVDNGAATYAGSWPNSTSVAGYQGSNYQFNAAGTGVNTVTWTASVATAGDYVVYARWTAHPNRATNATYAINYTGGSDSVAVNQQANGGQFVALGTYSLPAGDVTVTLTDNANGYVIADAIMVAPVGASPNTATWSFNVATAGSYEVYARWTAHPNRASDATYTINHASGTSSISVNQRQNGGDWQLLGSYSFNAGTATVELTDQANGYVIADAVMLVPPGAPPNQVVWDPQLAAAGEYEIYANWTAHPNRATDATYTVNHAAGIVGIDVNQEANGGTWNLLTTLILDENSTISLTDQANGYVIADAIRLVLTTSAGSVYYYHNDHLATPQVMTDESGVVVWQAAYEPFGEANVTTSLVENNLRFPGQFFDQETGLHYNYFRTFDPSTGRYLESDPIGLDGGLNTYAYVGGNPLVGIDMYGLQSVAACANPVNIPACTAAGMSLSGNALRARELASLISQIARAAAAAEAADNQDCNDRCKRAKAEARAAFTQLVSKRLPDYLTGGSGGPDAGHYKAIGQAMERLKKALIRVERHCNPLPLEYPMWKQVADMDIPKLH